MIFYLKIKNNNKKINLREENFINQNFLNLQRNVLINFTNKKIFKAVN